MGSRRDEFLFREMSGIEIAGLALGAIPVLLEAIKSYRDTYDHIQDFKHATPRLQIIDAQFRVCRINFLSECRLLLNLVLSDHQLSQEMIGNTQHDLWKDVTVERQLADLLHDDISACATIVKDTSATIQAFDARLSKLQVPPVSAPKLTTIALSDIVTCRRVLVLRCSGLGSRQIL